MSFLGLRQAYPRLGDDLFTVAGRAVQIVDWDRTHQFCGRCGAGMATLPGERAKACLRCGLHSYPRLSPSIIVRVSRGPAILLARSPRFPPGMYSVLAGFVEPGETLEQTIEREVSEEVGLALQNVQYFGSQPWPFPNSLMIAFTAEYAGGELRPDPAEIEDAAWFTPDNLPALPPPMSIARRMIDDFVEKRTL
jgi:NAD+ diphosphatase